MEEKSMADQQGEMWRDRQAAPGEGPDDEKMGEATKDGLGKLIGDEELTAEGRDDASQTIEEAADKLNTRPHGLQEAVTDEGRADERQA